MNSLRLRTGNEDRLIEGRSLLVSSMAWSERVRVEVVDVAGCHASAYALS